MNILNTTRVQNRIPARIDMFFSTKGAIVYLLFISAIKNIIRIPHKVSEMPAFSTISLLSIPNYVLLLIKIT